MSVWLNIIGIGEDGEAGLSAEALALLGEAEVIVGGDRHQKLANNETATRISWPSPFDAMIDEIKRHKDKRIVILVTGDPLWYSVGARIIKSIPAQEVRFFPQVSAFQWAACRMGWSLADLGTLTVHGRDAAQIIPHFAPNNRLLVLTKDASSPASVAKLLIERGFGRSKMSVLASLGGENEARFDGIAQSWEAEVPDFHTLAIECIADEAADNFSRVGGLADNQFSHDGQLTKRAVRAATLSALQPYPGALLWDIGAGCGSIGIEWMRAAREARAVAIEVNEARREMIGENARKLGVPKLKIIEGEAPEKLQGLERPDAVFIGGGLTRDGVFEAAFDALKPGGVLVANGVTLESEAMLFDLQASHGGTLEKIATSEMVSIGKYRGFKPAMSVTQYRVKKGTSS